MFYNRLLHKSHLRHCLRDQILVHWPGVGPYGIWASYWEEFTTLREIDSSWLFINGSVLEGFRSYTAVKDGVRVWSNLVEFWEMLTEGSSRKDRTHELRFGYVRISVWQKAEWKIYYWGSSWASEKTPYRKRRVKKVKGLSCTVMASDRWWRKLRGAGGWSDSRGIYRTGVVTDMGSFNGTNESHMRTGWHPCPWCQGR